MSSFISSIKSGIKYYFMSFYPPSDALVIDDDLGDTVDDFELSSSNGSSISDSSAIPRGDSSGQTSMSPEAIDSCDTVFIAMKTGENEFTIKILYSGAREPNKAKKIRDAITKIFYRFIIGEQKSGSKYRINSVICGTVDCEPDRSTSSYFIHSDKFPIQAIINRATSKDISKITDHVKDLLAPRENNLPQHGLLSYLVYDPIKKRYVEIPATTIVDAEGNQTLRILHPSDDNSRSCLYYKNGVCKHSTPENVDYIIKYLESLRDNYFNTKYGNAFHESDNKKSKRENLIDKLKEYLSFYVIASGLKRQFTRELYSVFDGITPDEFNLMSFVAVAVITLDTSKDTESKNQKRKKDKVVIIPVPDIPDNILERPPIIDIELPDELIRQATIYKDRQEDELGGGKYKTKTKRNKSKRKKTKTKKRKTKKRRKSRKIR